MIPNVMMMWNQREAQCQWCPEKITAGNPMVVVFFWNRGSPEHKGFNVKKYYHPDCWLAQGLDYLKMNPYSPYIRKQKLELEPTQAKRRYQLLRQKASIDQRIRKYQDSGDNHVMDISRLNIRTTELMMEIVGIGGIPARWLEQ